MLLCDCFTILRELKYLTKWALKRTCNPWHYVDSICGTGPSLLFFFFFSLSRCELLPIYWWWGSPTNTGVLGSTLYKDNESCNHSKSLSIHSINLMLCIVTNLCYETWRYFSFFFLFSVCLRKRKRYY